MRAVATLPSAGSMTTATMAIEITRYLRAPSLRNVDVASSATLGTRMAVTSSFGWRAVSRICGKV